MFTDAGQEHDYRDFYGLMSPAEAEIETWHRDTEKAAYLEKASIIGQSPFPEDAAWIAGYEAAARQSYLRAVS